MKRATARAAGCGSARPGRKALGTGPSPGTSLRGSASAPDGGHVARRALGLAQDEDRNGHGHAGGRGRGAEKTRNSLGAPQRPAGACLSAAEGMAAGTAPTAPGGRPPDAKPASASVSMGFRERQSDAQAQKSRPFLPLALRLQAPTGGPGVEFRGSVWRGFLSRLRLCGKGH